MSPIFNFSLFVISNVFRSVNMLPFCTNQKAIVSEFLFNNNKKKMVKTVLLNFLDFTFKSSRFFV